MSTAPALSRPAPASLADQEVVRAWVTLAGNSSQPVALDEIVIKRRVVAYRLRGVALDSHIIAKRCPRETAHVERLVYSEILPKSGLPALQCHGCVDIDDSDSCWLFMEDAGGENFSPETHPDHVTLAARWLATMHARAAEQAARAADPGQLPPRNVAHYLDHLREAQHRIVDGLSKNEAAAVHRQLLESIVRQCEKIERLEELFAKICSASPQTLVHGDFVEKNLRVRGQGQDAHLMVFDWEVAGFDAPAADLAQCEDLATYAAESQTPLQDLRRLALVGKVFRWACAVDWQSYSLAYPWVEKAMVCLRGYHDEMERLLAEVAKL